MLYNSGDKRVKTNLIENTMNAKTLFVSNIPYNAPKDSLEKLFKPFNGRNIKLAMRSHTENKGFGWVRFNSKSEAEMAIETTNNLNYFGRKLRVKFNK